MTTERLFAEVAQRIASLIRARGLAPGAKLPSEAELVAELGVSRPTLREALVALEVTGVVTVRKNAGAFVSAAPTQNLMTIGFDGEYGPFEQLEARLAIEPYAAYLAAQRRPDDLPRKMETTIIQMLKEHEDGFRTEIGDRDFHLLIAAACGNQLIENTIIQMWKMREKGQLWPELQKRVRVDEARTRAVYDHMRILDAIRRQDGEAAQSEMRQHLQAVMDSLDEAFPG
ncbi:FadR/GntR family transcriptional regulator [Paracoccus sp. Z330]|uniref:FadR/GntR family transcriptional regulator n=1 Tax=Paracoccus onchidii TaxID=3017813 RepID=A0ABT4ZG77_9RHOB|nr:FadR/GntR family transcriptional regulator [Paracoccus onchidii]MDB6178376.1 FadR/GntR family transcriptional regulator [Paracoccus onchidii]